MKKILLTISTFLIILCIGCNQTKSVDKEDITGKNSDTILIDTKNIPRFSDISHRVKDIKIIPLEEEEGNFIGGVDNVIIHKENYIVIDKRIAKNVFVFDKSGKYKAQLVNLGRGPGEIIQINDVWKNERGDIQVYDFGSRKVVTYNNDYTYKNSISTGRKYMFANISSVPGSDSYVGYAGYNIPNPPYNNKNYQVSWLSQEFIPNNAYALEYAEELRNALVYTSLSPFKKFDDSLRFVRYYDNNIYNIQDEGRITKRFILDYGSKQFPQNYENSIFLPNSRILKATEGGRDYSKISDLFEGYYMFAGSWFETQKYVMFQSDDPNRKTFVSLYDKKKNQVIAQSIVFRDSEKYHMLIPFPMTVENGRYVSVLPGQILIKYVDDPQSPFYDLVVENQEKNFIIEYTLI